METKISEALAKVSGVSDKVIRSGVRSEAVTVARRAKMVLLKLVTGAKHSVVAFRSGLKHHTSSVHAVQRFHRPKTPRDFAVASMVKSVCKILGVSEALEAKRGFQMEQEPYSAGASKYLRPLSNGQVYTVANREFIERRLGIGKSLGMSLLLIGSDMTEYEVYCAIHPPYRKHMLKKFPDAGIPTVEAVAVEEVPEVEPIEVPEVEHFIASDVISTVCIVCDVTQPELTGGRRLQRICRARHIVSYILKKHTFYTLSEIGAFTGRSDHTSVLAGIRVAKKWISEGGTESKLIDRCLEELGMLEAVAA